MDKANIASGSNRGGLTAKDFSLETDITAGCRQRARQALEQACIEASMYRGMQAKN